MSEEHKQVIDRQTKTQMIDLAMASRVLRKNRRAKQQLLQNREGHRKSDLHMFAKAYEVKGQEDQALIVSKIAKAELSKNRNTRLKFCSVSNHRTTGHEYDRILRQGNHWD
jgi:hypothetical protein